MLLFDSHAHLNISTFKDDYRETIARAQEKNIGLINVGVDLKSSRRAVEIAEEYGKGVYAAIGIHPSEANKDENKEIFDYKKILELAKNKKVVAIGECGLDYYRLQDENRKSQIIKQKELFIKHIELAKEVNKPLMIHCRAAFPDLIKILSEVVLGEAKNLNIIIHFFTGSNDDAKKLLTMGAYFTFGGLITFNRDFDEIIKFLPINKILLETDAPFVAPANHRGQRNEPLFLPEIAQKMAEIKNISFEEICEKTTENAKRIFKI